MSTESIKTNLCGHEHVSQDSGRFCILVTVFKNCNGWECAVENGQKYENSQQWVKRTSSHELTETLSKICFWICQSNDILYFLNTAQKRLSTKFITANHRNEPSWSINSDDDLTENQNFLQILNAILEPYAIRVMLFRLLSQLWQKRLQLLF